MILSVQFIGIWECGTCGVDLFQNVLDLGIHGGINTQPAVVDHLGRFGMGISVAAFQIVYDLVDDKINVEVLIDFLLFLLDRFMGGNVACVVGEDQVVCQRIVIFCVGDVTLIQHFFQALFLPFSVFFRIVERIKGIGRFGNGGQNRALGKV